MQKAIPFMQLRGGTSRGAYFYVDDLPPEQSLRDRILVAIMGGPDTLQVDGIGGGHPLTSKAAIVGPSQDGRAQVDYLFLQIDPVKQTVSTAQNCGNILAGVGPFAIETGIVTAEAGSTRVLVHMLNSGALSELTVATPGKKVSYSGDTCIDGVPGSAAPVVCDFLDVAGSLCGALLPTGNVMDVIDGVDTTCIDNGMPVVLLRATDLGVSGAESPEELDTKTELKARLEVIRLQAGKLMNLGDVSDKTVPKMILVSNPQSGGLVATRSFIPHACHKSVGVLAAVTTASACVMPGTVCDGIAKTPDGEQLCVDVEHPSGLLTVRLVLRRSSGERVDIMRSVVVRTARMITRGEVMVPASVWDTGSTTAAGSQENRDA